jgi:preflagellin peptidase FlaK
MVSESINDILTQGSSVTVKSLNGTKISQIGVKVYGMREWLEVSRVFLSLFFLGLSSWYDFRTREVSNKMWVFFGPIGLALTLLQLYVDHLEGAFTVPWFWLISVGLTTGISVALFFTGFFGGADSKALICLSIALPVYPSFVYGYVAVFVLFLPLAVLGNAVLFSSLLVVLIAIYNLTQMVHSQEKLFEGLEAEPLWRKILAFVTGFKVNSEKLKAGFHYILLEQLSRGENGELSRHLNVAPRMDGDDAQEEAQLEELLGKLDRKVWVTPGLPFLVFITIGLLVALFMGDFISWLVLRSVAPGAI